MSKNDDYTTKYLLDYFYHQNYFKLIGINLSRQINASIPQQVRFVKKLEENSCATMLFVSENQQKIFLNFFLHSLILTEKYK